ncbi:putative spore germination protein GerPC [Paenibacillus plantiphilus]|uniref:Spore germination protein GerPC n=1 Tax=Paenibacillus plantiphilus TaxID=2905650 RepID=A0ABN8GEC8_9BACL|nr:spore germination protein GerPC [Paenibacillus plantiphilus]CAH1206962.1 putative spore germination protein GerPC [Paenibacillus plantiphilus]
MQPTNGPSYSPWEMWTAMSRQLQQLAGTVAQQQAALQKLNNEMTVLMERVTSAESKPMYNVERLEYHFDQLKVEKLDGTLNIGMTPPTDEQFKEIGQVVIPNGSSPLHHGMMKQSEVKGLTDLNEPANASAPFLGMNPSNDLNGAMTQPPYPEIRRDVDLYLTTVAPQKLAQLEAECGLSLDPYHRNLILGDIRRQIDSRINYYMQTAAKSNQAPVEGSNESMLAQVHANVTAKTTRDIDAALQSYITRLKTANNQQGGVSS